MNQENTAKAVGGAMLLSTLTKNWDDCTVEEKLEKVREELRQLGHLTNRVTNLDICQNKLMKHTHADGKVVVPIEDNSTMYAGVTSRRNNLS